MKTYFASIICIGLFASTCVAQYGIPDDDDDDYPPASHHEQEVHLPAVVSRLQTTSAPTSYTKYEDEEPLAMHKYSPIYTARREQPASVYTEPIVIKTAVQPLKTVEFREESIRYEQPALITVKAITEKPVVVYSVPAPSYASISTTQIRFADGDDDYSSSRAVKGYSSPSSQVRFTDDNAIVPIVKYVMDSDHLGTFHVETVTGDGTSNTMSGQLKHLGGSEGPVVVKTGSYRFTGDDGQVYKVDWTADEEGFQASGDHLPTPPTPMY